MDEHIAVQQQRSSISREGYFSTSQTDLLSISARFILAIILHTQPKLVMVIELLDIMESNIAVLSTVKAYSTGVGSEITTAEL